MVLRKALLFSSMAIALVVLSPAASSAAATLQRPVIGLGQGTQTINLLTGAGTGANHGFLLGIGYFTGSGTSTFALTGPNTYSVTGTGTLLTANGEVFLASSGTGTLPGTTSGSTSQTSTTVDTITGGTGRFAGASGQLTIYARITSVSIVGSTETITTVGFWVGSISYPGR
jgi:hypothetical protein